MILICIFHFLIILFQDRRLDLLGACILHLVLIQKRSRISNNFLRCRSMSLTSFWTCSNSRSLSFLILLTSWSCEDASNFVLLSFFCVSYNFALLFQELNHSSFFLNKKSDTCLILTLLKKGRALSSYAHSSLIRTASCFWSSSWIEYL